MAKTNEGADGPGVSQKPFSTPAPNQTIEQLRVEKRDHTIRAIKSRRTMVERWSSDVEVSSDERWDQRAAAAVRLVPENVRVLDLGCGNMKIEPLLPVGCTYIPMDCVRRDARTMVVDLNRKRLPRVEADFVIGMGVLEYLFDMPAVLRDLARQIPEGMFSYHPLEQTPARDRLTLGWVNALNSSELIAIFKGAGFKGVTPHTYKPGVMFYRVSRSKQA